VVRIEDAVAVSAAPVAVPAVAVSRGHFQCDRDVSGESSFIRISVP
jgi:hypothetical protein